jgi:hypothetical protein
MARQLMIVAALLALTGLLQGASAQQGEPRDAERLESTRDTLAKWVETQQIISREKKDWQVGREVLEERITLIGNEITALEEKTATARKAVTDTDRKRQELLDENEALKSASLVLEETIEPLERKTLELVRWLPDPLRERVEPLSHRIPADPGATELSLGERFQNVIGVLNEVNKFNRDITVTSEIRTLPDGTSAEVKVLYLGLGQAYYVTPNGEGAGVGRPSAEGWVWTAANEHAAGIADALAILQNEKVPAFVPLPVEIQ